MLTIDQLRTDHNISGFRYVVRAGNKAGFQGSRNGGGRRDGWRGPLRATAEQAARDYCDYANGVNTLPPAALKTIKHKRPKRRQRPVQPGHIAQKRREVREWDREALAALPVCNHIYLMGVVGDRSGVKIGEAWDAGNRAAEGQTWHHRPLVVLGVVKTDIPRGADKIVHALFKKHHLNNEWFRPAQEVLSYFGVSNATFFRKTAERRTHA